MGIKEQTGRGRKVLVREAKTQSEVRLAEHSSNYKGLFLHVLNKTKGTEERNRSVLMVRYKQLAKEMRKDISPANRKAQF